jgi:TPR repeat protein
MENLRKLPVLFVCLLLSIGGINAQKGQISTLPDRDKAMAYAKRKLNGIGVTLDYKEAARILFALASNGDAEANSMIGMMYKQGLGCKQNDEKAVKYFKKAAELGYAKAVYNLGLMNKYGQGVEQNFGKAAELFQKADSMGSPNTEYRQGYIYYKGQGVPQSYEKAVKFFQKGADKGSGACMFFLALCYFKGQGVERDAAKAKSLVEMAAEAGYHRAVDFMQHENSATYGKKNTEISALRSVSNSPLQKAIPERFLRLKNEVTDNRIAGEWEGKILVYDWSGAEIEQEISLRASINVSGRDIQGVWIQNDTVNTPMNVTMADSVWIFNNLKIDLKRKSDIREGQFRLEKKDGEEFLTGSLNTYNEQLRESIAPTFVVLHRVFQSPTKITDVYAQAIKEPVASPNPFKDFVTVRFQLEKIQSYQIVLFDMSGKELYEKQDMGTLGLNQVTISTSTVPAGFYLLRISVENGCKSFKMRKQ